MKLSIYYRIVIQYTFLGCLMVSCHENEDIFKTPSNLRLQQTLKECKEVLISSDQGWRMDYKPANCDTINLTLKFTADNRVAMFIHTEVTSNSHYDFNGSEGPILSFDTYSALHDYVTPDQGKPGIGHGGDFEFIICEIKQDTIILKGRKNQDKVLLYRAREGEENKIRLMRLLQFGYRKKGNLFKGIRNKAVIADLSMEADCSILNIATEQSKQNTEVRYNNEGFILTSPIAIKEGQLSHFVWDPAIKSFRSGSYMIADLNAPLCATTDAEQILSGNQYEIREVSSGTLIDWFGSFEKAFPENQYYRFRFAGNGISNSALTFGFENDLFEIEENSITASTTNYLRNDRFRLMQIGYEGNKAREIYRNVAGKRLINFFFSEEGFTLHIENDTLYIVSVLDASRWVIIKSVQ